MDLKLYHWVAFVSNVHGKIIMNEQENYQYITKLFIIYKQTYTIIAINVCPYSNDHTSG